MLQYVTPYDKLSKDGKGNALHSGVASGGQEVHSVKSKFGGEPGSPTLTLMLSNGKEIVMSTGEAEVTFAQLLAKLAAMNIRAKQAT